MLVVGLGNPGSQYAHTRHNIGFMVIDKLLQRLSTSAIHKAEFHGELFKFHNIFFLKPMTFMNLSGDSVIAVKRFYKIEEVVVIHDDLDLPFGAIRFKKGGGDGGHNGLKSVNSVIHADYMRVRMGISKPKYKGEIVSYVLSDFSADEAAHLEQWISHAADAVLKLQEMSFEAVSSLYSIKKI